MDRMYLSDDLIRSLAPAPTLDARYYVFDTSVENLAVRVRASAKSFVCTDNLVDPGSHAVRRLLGVFPEMSVEEARIAARDWNRRGSNFGRTAKPGVEPSARKRALVRRERIFDMEEARA